MAYIETTIFSIALIGGILPPVVWLWFWLKEDARHPEPRSLIFATFLAGMVAVPVAYYAERGVAALFPVYEDLSVGAGLFIFFAILVSIEEILKLVAAYSVAFSTKFYDEPVDSIIYLITAALGFAALENTLFLVSALADISFTSVTDLVFDPSFAHVLLQGNLRFIGANVLHVLASGILGVFIGLSFYRRPAVRVLYGFIGLLLATVLHALFNYLILSQEGSGASVFAYFWVSAIVLILLFEKVKQVHFAR